MFKREVVFYKSVHLSLVFSFVPYASRTDSSYMTSIKALHCEEIVKETSK